MGLSLTIINAGLLFQTERKRSAGLQPSAVRNDIVFVQSPGLNFHNIAWKASLFTLVYVSDPDFQNLFKHIFQLRDCCSLLRLLNSSRNCSDSCNYIVIE